MDIPLHHYFPIVSPEIVGMMVHRTYTGPGPENVENSSFRSDLSWDEIKQIVTDYFERNKFNFVISRSTGSFTVGGTPNDEKLSLDIIVYLDKKNNTFVFDPKRNSGSVFTSHVIFSDLRSLLNKKISVDQLMADKKQKEEEEEKINANKQQDGKKEYNFDLLQFDN